MAAKHLSIDASRSIPPHDATASRYDRAMSTTDSLPFVISDLNSLPRRAADTWHAGVHWLRNFRWDAKSKAPTCDRLGIAVVLDQRGVGHPVPLKDENVTAPDAIRDVVLARARDPEVKYLPGKIRVESEQLAAPLRAMLEPLGVGFEIKPSKAVHAMGSQVESVVFNRDQSGPLGMMSVSGITENMVEGFATDAAAYAKSKPWRWRNHEQAFEIEWERAIPNPFPIAVPMGALGECVGIAFYRSFEALEQFATRASEGPEAAFRGMREPLWSIMYDEINLLPADDAELWTEKRLPIAGRKFFPLAVGAVNAEARVRPDAQTLRSMRAALAALSSASTADRKATKWERQIKLDDGPTTIHVQEIEPLG
jgi:hypothetical protein